MDAQPTSSLIPPGGADRCFSTRFSLVRNHRYPELHHTLIQDLHSVLTTNHQISLRNPRKKTPPRHPPFMRTPFHDRLNHAASDHQQKRTPVSPLSFAMQLKSLIYPSATIKRTHLRRAK